MKIYKMFVIIPLLFTTGCGLIINGSMQKLNIKTDPPGLSAVVMGKSCVTPCMLNVPRKSTEILISRPNGTDLRTELNRDFNWWIVPGNIWNDIWIGVIVDTVTGAAWTIEDVDIKIPKSETLLKEKE